MTEDPFGLERFVTAQNGIFSGVLAELRAGRKTNHWMWFVFPQIQGLGRSATAQQYAISGPDEARAYLDHPVLGPRLRECVSVLLALPVSDPASIFGSIDAMKLRSSMTLFALAAPDEAEFRAVLDTFFGGELDSATLSRLT